MTGQRTASSTAYRKLNLKKKMLINLSIVSSLVAILAINCPVSADEDGELEIHYTFKPEDCEPKAKVTDLITLHYKGTMKDGKVFDSSHERGEPLTVQIGIGQVILGWDQGLLGVCKGEKRRLVVPPHLGYGQAKHDQIPPNSTLIFDIQVEKIEKGPKPANVFQDIDADGDGRLSREEMGYFLGHQLDDARRHGDKVDDADHPRLLDEIFAHEDKDGDNYISHDEFSGTKHDHDEL